MRPFAPTLLLMRIGIITMKRKTTPLLFLTASLLLGACTFGGGDSTTSEDQTSSLEPSSSLNEQSSEQSSSSETSSSQSSSEEPSSEQTSVDTGIVSDLTTTIYAGDDLLGESPLIAWEGEEESYSLEVVDSTKDNVNIRIEDNKIIGLLGGTTTEVRLTAASGYTETFNVTVTNHTYSSNYSSLWSSEDFETTEDWFDTSNAINSTSITEISNLSSDFANGMDISSVMALYENGARYFNDKGQEQSLFYLLKDAGVNWVRLRLWNDPSETYNGTTYNYGGGDCSLDKVIWMAHEAKMAGLKILLDFHYSDFWTHPGQQVVPKAWMNLSSVEEVSNAIKEYTKETLIAMYEADAMPSMVQLGNEISSGMLMKTPKAINTEATTTAQGDNPLYISSTSDFAYQGVSGGNMTTYLSSASSGVDEAIAEIGTSNLNEAIGETDIKKAIHFTSTMNYSTYPNRFNESTTLSRFRSFYNNLASVDYDVIALSAYPFYDFRTDFSAFTNGLNTMASYFPDKEIMIAETSSPFTNDGWNDFTSNSVWYSDSDQASLSFSMDILGQATVIHDMTEAVSNLTNGIGVFYWESAWLPIGEAGSNTPYVGWADEGSKVSWANQALFSFGGKALGSLKVYELMNPKA